jgi:hypothetical protein
LVGFDQMTNIELLLPVGEKVAIDLEAKQLLLLDNQANLCAASFPKKKVLRQASMSWLRLFKSFARH